MTYREKGYQFCKEINKLLDDNSIKAAFVTGGGFAYDSIKYNDGKNKGDYDFMIVYEDENEVKKIVELIAESNFEFEKKYLDIDLDLLESHKIDIIRLSGKYIETKGTINLVPKSIIEKISNLQDNLVIRKVAHNRNTSLFFAYGSDNSRIITNFISPSFITEDGEDHYIHLDFSLIKKNKNIYLGILADALLKGFNKNYDTIGFSELRKNFIKKIHDFFEMNNIDSTGFINLFSNNNYFPEYLKEALLSEFNEYGTIIGNISKSKQLEPIVFTTDFTSTFESRPFNFVNNKSYKSGFIDYIKLMQSNEYNRQYLLDALGKFFGYILSSKHGSFDYNESVLDKIEVYGVNDLYLPNIEEYTPESIIRTFISDLKKNSDILNSELIRNYLIISMKFLGQITKEPISNIMRQENIDNSIFNPELDTKMNISVIKSLSNFNEIGTYHNYTSKVMPKYTITEAKFLESLIADKAAKILDIMCGYGRLANQLALDGYSRITGIDREDYSFLGIPKDFVYIKNDFLDYKFKDKYNFAYSLYNCYGSIEEISKNIEKTHSLLDESGSFVIDVFNKEWRDSIDPNFYKELYVDDRHKLIIKRTYDSKTGEEFTIYELYINNLFTNEWTFTQQFFNLEDVIETIDGSKWDFSVYNSGSLTTRTNEQKNIMILRRK